MELSCAYEFRPKRPTCNTSYVQSVFGIGFEVGRNVIASDVEVDYSPGKIVLFCGPSGSGKSSLLREAARQAGATRECMPLAWLDDMPLAEAALIDTLGQDPRDAAHLLSLCGLGEAFLMLRSPEELSDGQRYRYGIAKRLAEGAMSVAADEWCAKLDRVTAKVISHNVRKTADRRGAGFLLATTHEDIIDDLQPDSIVWCRGGGTVEVDKRRPFRGQVSFLGQLRITEGSASDWPYFARWHYRGAGLGPVRRVLLLWHGQVPIGICIFGFGPLSSGPRNRLFGIRQRLTKPLARWINDNFAAVVRLVLVPRYRGAGIAAAFLRRCCELSSWPWIELSSEMAALVPFCEAAGFRPAGKGLDKSRRSGRLTGPPRKSESPYGKSAWTEQTFRAYWRRVRFSRPAYYIFDNRRGRQENMKRSNKPESGKPSVVSD